MPTLSRRPCVNNTQFYIGQNEIAPANVVIDLGVTISQDLKWSHHVCRIQFVALLRAYQYQVLHPFLSNNVWTLLKAYITYVRPKLEFNTPVWSPYLKKDIVSLESVQKKFTRQICIRCNISFKSYTDRLHKLNINTLEYRRVEYDLILLYKICHNLSDLNFHDYFVYRCTGYNLRQHNWTIQSISHPKHNQFKYFFSNRTPQVWNKLPDSLVSASNLSIFKSHLKRFDLHNIVTLVF